MASVVSDSVTIWTVAHQAPLSMGFCRQEYWSVLPFPSPGDLPYPGLNLHLLHCRWRSLGFMYILKMIHILWPHICLAVRGGGENKVKKELKTRTHDILSNNYLPMNEIFHTIFLT